MIGSKETWGGNKKICKGVRNFTFVLFTAYNLEASRMWRAIWASACVGVSQRLPAAGVVRDGWLVGVSVPARIRLCHAVAPSQSVGSKTFVGERNRVLSGRRLGGHLRCCDFVISSAVLSADKKISNRHRSYVEITLGEI